MRRPFQSERKQTRRTISLRADVHDRLRTYAEERGIAMSALVERIIAPTIGADAPERT